MIRTGFKTKRPAAHVQLDRIPQHYARLTVKVNVARIDDVVLAIPKENPVRSEEYRRLVAAMPCKACGIRGYSQAAHVPPDGKGIKQSDLEIFALCCTRPGIPGCHVEFDQFSMYPRLKAVMVAKAWAADTRRQIIAEGKWPVKLARMDGEVA